MKISVPCEIHPGETRAPMTPEGAAKLVKLGAEVTVQAGLGLAAGFADDAYTKAGASVATDRQALVSAGDLVLRLRKPPAAAQTGFHPRQPAGSVQRKGARAEICRARRQRHQHGIHPAHHPRAENGRALLAGQPGRLRGGDSRRALFQQNFSHDDHGGGHHPAVEGFHHRRRRRGLAGHRHGQTARRESHRLRHAARWSRNR
jgi:hypothetical protein